MLADNAALVLPLHRDLDAAREARAGAGRIGTTGRGIGPAYEDKVGRRAIRFCDLADPAALHAKIERLLAHHEPLRRGLDLPEVTAEDLLALLPRSAPKVAPYRPAGLARAGRRRCRTGRRVLFEGAQATMLDVDHGTYPFVTSSNTVAGQAATGSGVGPRVGRLCAGHRQGLHHPGGRGALSHASCTTRSASMLGARGHEFGTNTGRKRRCGWFDAVLVRQSVAISGIQGVALTKLDVLDGFDDPEDLRRLSAGRPDAGLSAGRV